MDQSKGNSSIRRNTLILVVGMHRSGTSAVTRMLNLAGLDLPCNLMAATEENARGYWESQDVADANEAFLRDLGLGYDALAAKPRDFENHPAAHPLKERIRDVFEIAPGHQPLVVKDPRISRLLPLWIEMAKEADYAAKVVFMVRNPLEVMRSLDARGISAEKAALLWLLYNLEGEAGSRGIERVFVSYDELLTDWRTQLARIYSSLSLGLHGLTAERAAEIDEFISPSLRHHTFRRREVAWDERCDRWTRETYEALDAACHDETADLQARMDDVRGQFEQSVDVLADIVNRKDAQIYALVTPDKLPAPVLEHEAALEGLLEASSQTVLGLTAAVKEQTLALNSIRAEAERTRILLSNAMDSIQRLSMSIEVNRREAQRERDSLLANFAEERAVLEQRLSEEFAHAQMEATQRAEWEGRAQWLASFVQRGPQFKLLSLLRRFGLPGKLIAIAAGLYGGGVTLNPVRLRSLLWQRRVLLHSPLFDGPYYTAEYWDVGATGVDPALHYLRVGAAEGRNPGPDFDTAFYLSAYPDVRRANINPLVHYVRSGAKEGRLIRPPHTPGARPPVVGGAYGARPDEGVRAEADRGNGFFAQYGLLGGAPDFAAATAHLAAMERTLPAATHGAPDVSIIVPVYGQLAYTLNCLHSLASHASRYSAEVIVVDDCSPDATRRHLRTLDWVQLVEQKTNGGFIASCNAGAAQARGEYIVLLNNDTRVVPGWLDEMIDTFQTHPHAGLVGSKLFYPDGELQEAGGIVWRDGSAWNYGRGQDSNQPAFCYARRTDYCSGASIAVPRQLWRQLGGFDGGLFERSYCEDCDMAFRVRAAGREAWFQPLSRVIHYEGKTGGTDTASGEKSYQVTNQKRLFERWRSVLSTHAENGVEPYREADRTSSRIALVIDACSPEPWSDAGSVTVVNTILALQKLDYRVVFAPQSNMLYLRQSAEMLQRLGVEVLYYPYYMRVADYLKQHGALIDLVHIFRYGVAEEVLEDVRQFVPAAHVTFNVMDLHHLRMAREARLSGNAEALRRAETEIKKRELDVIERVDTAFVHTIPERDIVAAERPRANVRLYPYVVDETGREGGFDEREGVMFLGGYGHEPNIDAVTFFVASVMPHLRSLLPGVKFHIAGSQVNNRIRGLAADDVVIDGFVPRLKDYFSRFRVFVAPLRYGAGIKGKVAAALVHGTPSVLTPIAAEGIDLVDGVHAMIREEPRAIAEAIAEIYQNRAQWEAMSDAALKYGLRTFSLEAACAAFEDALSRPRCAAANEI